LFQATGAKRAKTKLDVGQSDGVPDVSPAIDKDTVNGDSATPDIICIESQTESQAGTSSCEYLFEGTWRKARICKSKTESGTTFLCIQIIEKSGLLSETNAEEIWVEQTSAELRIECNADSANKGTVEGSCKAPKNKSAGRQKAIARIKPANGAPVPAIEQDIPTVKKDVTLTGGNVQPVVKSVTKVEKNLSSEEREKRERLIRDELFMLSEMRVYGDFIPFLRPSAEELLELEEMKNCEGPLPIKIRQLYSRHIEGRAMTFVQVLECLKSTVSTLVFAENSSAGLEIERLDGLAALLAENVECRPQFVHGIKEQSGPAENIADTNVDEPEVSRRLAIKDMADIPEKFRSIVDVHRKMESAIKERMMHLQMMLNEVKCGGKNLAKMDRVLVSMKDKYAKLEDRERKDKEKLESKLEADRKKIEETRKKQEEMRKKQEEKLEEARRKQEELRKKQEEKDEKLKKKEEETRIKEKKVLNSECQIFNCAI
jgi:hypothetical protein